MSSAPPGTGPESPDQELVRRLEALLAYLTAQQVSQLYAWIAAALTLPGSVLTIQDIIDWLKGEFGITEATESECLTMLEVLNDHYPETA